MGVPPARATRFRLDSGLKLAVLIVLLLVHGACAKGVAPPPDPSGVSIDSGVATGGVGGSGGAGGSGGIDGGDGADDAGGGVDAALADAGTGTDAGNDASTDAGHDAATPTGPKRKLLTIAGPDNVGVVGSQTAFPVLVRIVGADFAELEDDVDVDGHDLRFTSDAAGTTNLPFERVRYDELGNELIAWVTMDLADTGQAFNLVYGEGDLSDKSSSAAWSNAYAAVWHLEDVANLADASGNGHTGTNQGAAYAITSISGGAAAFNGSSAYISTSPIAAIDGGTFTIAAWVLRDTNNTYDYIVSQGDSGATRTAFHWGLENTGDGSNFRFAFWGDDLNSPASHNETAVYVYWVGTFDAASRARVQYRNAVQVASDTAGGALDTTGNFEIGRQSFSNIDYWDGLIDEVRVSSVVRSASWIQTEYNNQKPGSTFMTIGAEEPL